MTPAPSNFTLFHEIFILDAYIQRKLDESKKDSITKNLVNDLLTALRMDPLGDLNIFPAVDLRAPGWSFIIPITTSHIAGHYFEGPGRRPHIRMDTYSCASVNWRKLIDILHKHIGLEKWRATFIDRQIGVDGSERMMVDIYGVGDQVLDERKLFVQNPALAAEYISREAPVAARV
ncbi:hypothetical protein KKF55_01075 [Patescibacteria group bacterium]|nr:hypothetical protein [Patescibacteria group bacterium]